MSDCDYRFDEFAGVWLCGHCGDRRASPARRNCRAPVPRGFGDVACTFRGEQIDTRECDTCGQRGQLAPVFECQHPDHAGEPCVRRWWTNKAKARDGYLCCLLCRDRQLPDGTKPWSDQ